MSNSFADTWTVAHQVPLSMGFPKKEHWSGFSFPSPGFLEIGRCKQKQNHSVGRAMSYAKLQLAELSIDLCPLKLVDTSIYKCVLK